MYQEINLFSNSESWLKLVWYMSSLLETIKSSDRLVVMLIKQLKVVK